MEDYNNYIIVRDILLLYKKSGINDVDLFLKMLQELDHVLISNYTYSETLDIPQIKEKEWNIILRKYKLLDIL